MFKWFIFPLGRYSRFTFDGEHYEPSEEDEEKNISHYVVDDYGDLVPVIDCS